jgi:hypothetical protein
MTPQKALLYNYQELTIPRTILLGDNSRYTATDFSSVILLLSIGQHLMFHEILHVSGLAKKILSVAQFTKTDNTIIIFKCDHCVISTRSPTSQEFQKLYIKKDDNLFFLGIGIEQSNPSYMATTLPQSDLDTMKWHHRLSHLNIKYLNIMQTKKIVIGLPIFKSTLLMCEGCISGKHHKLPYSTTPITRAIEVLALIYTDLYGSMKIPSFSDALYFLIFIDNYSRYMHVYFLKKKSMVLDHFIQYKASVENQTRE